MANARCEERRGRQKEVEKCCYNDLKEKDVKKWRGKANDRKVWKASNHSAVNLKGLLKLNTPTIYSVFV